MGRQIPSVRALDEDRRTCGGSSYMVADALGLADHYGNPGNRGMAWTPSPWSVVDNGDHQVPSYEEGDRTVPAAGERERVPAQDGGDLRGGAGLSVQGAHGTYRSGDVGGNGPQHGIADNIRALAERAFQLARDLSAIAAEAGVISDGDPLSVTPRDPRSPHQRMKGRP